MYPENHRDIAHLTDEHVTGILDNLTVQSLKNILANWKKDIKKYHHFSRTKDNENDKSYCFAVSSTLARCYNEICDGKSSK